jgi:hypothetical protein
MNWLSLGKEIYINLYELITNYFWGIIFKIINEIFKNCLFWMKILINPKKTKSYKEKLILSIVNNLLKYFQRKEYNFIIIIKIIIYKD